MIAAPVLFTAHADVPLQLFPEEGREAITIVVVVLFLIGLGAIYAGYRERRRAASLESRDVVDAGSVTEGSVALEGTARLADESVDSPLDDEAVIARVTRTRAVETRWVDAEAARDRDAGIESQETNVERYTSEDAVPFYVTGDPGTVLVDAESDVRLELRSSETVTEEVEHESHHRLVDEERTKKISLLQDGDEVFVFGRAERFDDERADAVVRPDDETGELIVSHFDRETLVDRYTTNAPIALALGAATAVASLGLLVYEYVLA